VITYRFADSLIESQSAEPTDILTAMRDESIFCCDEPQQEYMEGLATRVKNYAGVEISTVSVEAFIDSLIVNGFLIRDDVGAE